MNDRRPFQISLKGLFALTFFAAISFWLASTSRWKPQSLVGCYLLVGFVQVLLSRWIRRNVASHSEHRVERREAIDSALAACFFSLPLWLFIMIEMIMQKLSSMDAIFLLLDGHPNWSAVFYTCAVFHISTFLLNLSSCFGSFRLLRDWPLSVLRLLNFANLVFVCVILFVCMAGETPRQ